MEGEKMNMSKKLLCSLLSVCFVGSLCAPANAANDNKIVILHTNDVHCAIDQVKEDDGTISSMGYAAVAAYKKQMQTEYGTENVTLIDAGDAIQGGPIGTLSKGEYLVDIMNEVGYDIAVPGNHEFDYGCDTFFDLTKKAEYSYVCSNLTDLSGKTLLEPYKMVSYDDVDVAYIGIDTPESFTKSTPTYFQDKNGNYIYSFCQGNDGQDLYDAVQTAIDSAEKAGAEYIVAVGHLGNEGSTAEWTSKAVIKNTSGIDVFIDGHSHETYNEVVTDSEGEDVFLAQTGTKLANIGQITIDTATGEIESKNISGYSVQDEQTASFIEKINAEFNDILKKVVATSSVDLTTLDTETGKRAIRNAETNLGDLCADAYRSMLEADIAFVNGGGIRADISKGDITYEDIINVHPYGNEACLVEATGQEILDALEMGARLYPEENGGFLQVSGLTYTINENIPSSVEINDMGEFVKVNGEYRVSDVVVNGEALDLTKTYTLSSHNYMLKSGGDGFVMFKDNTILKDSVMIDNAVLINYITEKLGGVVSDDYSNPQGQGRIKIVSDSFELPSDVSENAWYAVAVKFVMQNGYMNGTGTGFNPTGTVTRGTVYQTLYNMAGSPSVADSSSSFTDISGKWYEKAAIWAESTGLTSGTGNSQFSGDKAMTRQELAKVFADYSAKNEIKPEKIVDISSYTDVKNVADWALDGMKTSVSLGIIKGSNNSLNPTGTALRSELAQIIVNFSNLLSA